MREADAARVEERAAALGNAIRAIGRAERGAGAALAGPRGEREIADIGHDHFEAVR